MSPTCNGAAGAQDDAHILRPAVQNRHMTTPSTLSALSIA
ncbi:bifunctional hydroxymethylpyrimidine kinase/phosphomethylpyrimidine kinase, partial [Xanthomonas perforans]